MLSEHNRTENSFYKRREYLGRNNDSKTFKENNKTLNKNQTQMYLRDKIKYKNVLEKNEGSIRIRMYCNNLKKPSTNKELLNKTMYLKYKDNNKELLDNSRIKEMENNLPYNSSRNNESKFIFRRYRKKYFSSSDVDKGINECIYTINDKLLEIE